MWKVIDNYHMKNGDFTITKAVNVKYPYGLYHLNKSYGYFETSDEAKQRYEELNNGR